MNTHGFRWKEKRKKWKKFLPCSIRTGSFPAVNLLIHYQERIILDPMTYETERERGDLFRCPHRETKKTEEEEEEKRTPVFYIKTLTSLICRVERDDK